jgi:hypothetical protein
VAWLATEAIGSGRVQGIQDVQLGDVGSRMAVIDPSYQDAGTRWEGRIVHTGSLAAGPIVYVFLAMSHTVGDFASPKATHWCICSLAHRWRTATSTARWIRHRYRCTGWPGRRAKNRDPEVDDVITVTLAALEHIGELIAPAIACRRSL